MRLSRRPARLLFVRGIAVILALQLAAATAGLPAKHAVSKGDSKKPDGVVAVKTSLRPLLPIVKRPASPTLDRIPTVEVPAQSASSPADPGSDSDLTRPLYLQSFLPGHPQRRRAPPA